MAAAAKIYANIAKYFLKCNLQNPCPDGTDWTLDAALGSYKSFYVLEALPKKWSNIQYYSPIQVQLPCFFQVYLMHAHPAGWHGV